MLAKIGNIIRSNGTGNLYLIVKLEEDDVLCYRLSGRINMFPDPVKPMFNFSLQALDCCFRCPTISRHQYQMNEMRNKREM